MAWFECSGGSSGGDYDVEFFSCTFFNGEGIILPYTINADYKVSVSFYETSIQTDAAIIGNSLDATHVHLTENSNRWYTSGGNSLDEMGAWSGNVVHTFVCNNGNSHNEFDGVEKNSYTPTTDNNIYYTVGCRGINNQAKPWAVALIGYIKWFKIESLSTGNVICELKPCQIKKGSTVIAHGMMDIANDIFYSNSGMIASNDH